MKRTIALVLALLLALGLMSACGAPAAQETNEAPAPAEAPETPAETPEATLPSAVTVADPAAAAYQRAFEKIAPDEPILEINGRVVRWREFFYWMHSIVKTIEAYYGEITDFNAPFDLDELGRSYTEHILYYTENSVAQYRVMETLAEDWGLGLTEESRETLQGQWAQDVNDYCGGDEQAFLDLLAEDFIDRELYEYLNYCAYLYVDCFAQRYGENGENCPDEAALAYAEENGYVRVKHLLFSTLDADRQPLPEDEKADKRAAAEDALKQLQAAADKEAAMDALMPMSEDPGSAYYTDGYTFGKGKMVQEFEDAAYALSEGELSGVVETSYGYHILLRLPIDPDAVFEIDQSTGTPYTLRFDAAQLRYEGELDEGVANAQFDRLPILEALDLQEIFNG